MLVFDIKNSLIWPNSVFLIYLPTNLMNSKSWKLLNVPYKPVL